MIGASHPLTLRRDCSGLVISIRRKPPKAVSQPPAGALTVELKPPIIGRQILESPQVRTITPHRLELISVRETAAKGGERRIPATAIIEIPRASRAIFDCGPRSHPHVQQPRFSLTTDRPFDTISRAPASAWAILRCLLADAEDMKIGGFR